MTDLRRRTQQVEPTNARLRPRLLPRLRFCLCPGLRLRPRLLQRLGFLPLLATVWVPLSACVSSSPHAAKPHHPQPVLASAQQPLDASYDWHGLLAAPFGSPLKSVPLNLHEVLLFRDEAHSAAANDYPECYTSDAAPPRFVGHVADEYLLCFKQDRLTRVQASVRLSAAGAPSVFGAACTLWMKNAAAASSVGMLGVAPGSAAPTAPVPGSPGIATPGLNGSSTAGTQSGEACEGLDHGVHFVGRLGEEPVSAETSGVAAPGADASGSETPLSIVLDGPHDRQ